MQTNIAPENKKHFKLIKEALNERRLAIFVGAGVSRATNPNYPSWAKVTETLKEGLPGCEETDPLKIAQLYALKFNNLILKETVKSCFPPKDIPSDIQESILDLKPHYIISTNWDCLFENFLNEKISYIYDVIASDRELIESRNDNKIIKMHGDFPHNNYVLTEDDYLNYSKNFPLIENYVKSIISTHTVVMIGYSFSDIDLKQIINWLQIHSTVQPPIFMVVNKKNEYAERYLQKFGIITIAQETDFNKYLRDFLNNLTLLDDFSQAPEKYIYNKIKKYEKYRTILQRDICGSLGNCEIWYDSQKRGILHFFEYESILEEENIQRAIFNKFIRTFNENDETTRQIIGILSKANITGIIISKNENGTYKFKSYADICEYKESRLLNFDFSTYKTNKNIDDFINDVLCLVEQGRIHEALEINKIFISHCEKTRNYIYLFIGFFNHSQLLSQLRHSSPKTRDLVKDEKIYSLDDLFISLPKDLQSEYREIYHFLTKQDLYKKHFEITNDVQEKERKIEIIENGGMAFSSDDGKFQTQLKNLIEFVLDNGICFERNSIYRKICQNYVKISFLQQYDKRTISLDKTELYACIKYYSSDELHKLFKDFRKPSKRKVFKLDCNLLEWLVDEALKNCISHFILDNKGEIYTYYDQYIANILFLLGQNKLTEELVDKIWSLINQLVEEASNTLAIFSAINTFIAIQWNLNQKVFKEKQFITLLENLLKKFIFKKMNGHEEWALSLNRLYNLYNCCHALQSKFTSNTIISQVIQNIDNLTQHDKICFIQNVLLELYQISDKKCQKEIRQYVSKQKFVKSEDFNSYLDIVNYHLHLTALDIEKSKNKICQMVKGMIQEYPEKVYYNSIQSTLSLSEYLQKKNPYFTDIYKIIQEKVNKLDKEFGHTRPLKAIKNNKRTF